MICSICAGQEFKDHAVLWPDLIRQWGLTAEELEIVNREQGTICMNCRSNLRSIGLAGAILASRKIQPPLTEAIDNGSLANARILEVNRAGTLTPWLEQLPNHRLIEYPAHDIHDLQFADASFDLVVHSDTLEHVSDPVLALSECRRVLDVGGVCAFTVPVLPGRLTRSRDGLEPSFHGAQDSPANDLLVQWEFGADVWTPVMQAGFASCSLQALDYPAGLAILALV